jgi:predicted tellurium resistance membrane protein TerC
MHTPLPFLHDLVPTLASAVELDSGAGLFSTASLIALLTLTALEIVLGIDNVVFIAILANGLPESQRARARRLGLVLAMVMRILLLLCIAWIMGLTAPLFEIPFLTDPSAVHGAAAPEDPPNLAISGRDLVLLLGGLFLIAKATWEIRHETSGRHQSAKKAAVKAAFSAVIAQIVVIDLVFSLDSVITAVGMADRIEIMIAAVVISMGVMLAAAGYIARFIERHPELKVLALAFLVLIGVLLVADGLHQHLDRGYVYFAMAFALAVDLIQMRVNPHQPPGSPGEGPHGPTD